MADFYVLFSDCKALFPLGYLLVSKRCNRSFFLKCIFSISLYVKVPQVLKKLNPPKSFDIFKQGSADYNCHHFNAVLTMTRNYIFIATQTLKRLSLQL